MTSCIWLTALDSGCGLVPQMNHLFPDLPEGLLQTLEELVPEFTLVGSFARDYWVHTIAGLPRGARTHDVDIAILVPSIDIYRKKLERLDGPNATGIRLLVNGFGVDIIPYGSDVAPSGIVETVSRAADQEGSWNNGDMGTALRLDLAAIRRACQRHGVTRLRIFGSATTEHFDPQTSDIDFLVDFAPDNPNLFHDYFDLKFALEEITGRPVDLVDASTVRNPYFRASAISTAQDLYAA